MPLNSSLTPLLRFEATRTSITFCLTEWRLEELKFDQSSLGEAFFLPSNSFQGYNYKQDDEKNGMRPNVNRKFQNDQIGELNELH